MKKVKICQRGPVIIFNVEWLSSSTLMILAFLKLAKIAHTIIGTKNKLNISPNIISAITRD